MHGAVVEVWHGMMDNYHYYNMAHFLGHSYHNVQSHIDARAIDVEALAKAVMAAMDDVYARVEQNVNGDGGSSGSLLESRWLGRLVGGG